MTIDCRHTMPCFAPGCETEHVPVLLQDRLGLQLPHPVIKGRQSSAAGPGGAPAAPPGGAWGAAAEAGETTRFAVPKPTAF